MPPVVVLILTVYQLLRVIAFVNVYGGIEHDGGWLLSVSRSLAERNTYTTMVSTIVDPSVPGAFSVDLKYDVQADDGRIWFFTGNGIGPASVVPDALIIKLFGVGFWALRLGPLLFYAGFLVLAALALYRVAGLGAVVLFHAFMFFYPHLSIFLSYEAMGEVPAMFYVLLAFLLFARARTDPARPAWRFGVAGIAVGLAINTKLIALMSVSGLFLIAAIDSLWPMVDKSGAARKFTPEALLAIAAGLAAPLALWELIQCIVIVRLAGVEAYRQHLGQRWWFVLNDGSGIGDRGTTGLDAIIAKFFVLSEVTHPERWVVILMFVAVLLGGAALVWWWRVRTRHETLMAAAWLGWLVNTIWFVGIAKTGWVRHDWFALVLFAMLVSTLSTIWIGGGERNARRAEGPTRKRRLIRTSSGVLILGLTFWGFASQPHVRGFFLPDEIVPFWQAKQIADRSSASLPWIITPRAAQEEVAKYIRRLPSASNVYYLGGHKTAELTPLTGRVHYPIARRALAGPQPLDVLVLGPSIVSPWQSESDRTSKITSARRECWKPLIVNDFYWLCALPIPVPAALQYTNKETVFQNGIHLLGYNTPANTPRAGDGFVITLFWQTDRPIVQNYTAFVHLLGAQWNAKTNNPLWGQSDQQPASGASATTTWKPGAVIADAHVFRIAPDAPPGEYQLEVGLYAPGTGVRLTAQDGSDHAIITQLDVQP